MCERNVSMLKMARAAAAAASVNNSSNNNNNNNKNKIELFDYESQERNATPSSSPSSVIDGAHLHMKEAISEIAAELKVNKASTKCQPSSAITTTTNNTNNNNNNSEVATNSVSVTTQEQAASNGATTEAKWPCHVCTYFNWPKSLKCVQCYTPRRKPTASAAAAAAVVAADAAQTTADATVETDAVASLSLSLPSMSPPSPQPAAASAAVATLPTTTPSTPTTTTTMTSNQNGSNDSTTASQLKKWSCATCTYLNYPRSQRCVMCHEARELPPSPSPSPSPSPPPSSVSANVNVVPVNNMTTSTAAAAANNASTVRPAALQSPSPPPPPPPPTIAKTTTREETTTTTTTSNNKSKKSEMDRLFLAACQGIVDNHMHHLNLYIFAGGDLTRYLTHDECKLLGRPGTFTTGLTLIHLCYQFNKKEFLINLLNQTTKNLRNKSTTLTTATNTNNNNNKNAHSSAASPYVGSSSLSSSYKTTNGAICLNHKSKYTPCQSSPELASHILLRYFSANLRQRKTNATTIGNSHNASASSETTNGSNTFNGGGGGDNSNTSSSSSNNATMCYFAAPNAASMRHHHQQHHIGLKLSDNGLSDDFSSPSPSPPPPALFPHLFSSSSSSSPTSSMSHHHHHHPHHYASLSTYGGGAHAYQNPSHGHYQQQQQHQLFYAQQQQQQQQAMAMAMAPLSVCFYVNESHTFILPNEIDDFSPRIQHTLFDELLDRHVQQELECESRAINWNVDLCKRLNSRLYPLWNRSQGDCLLDSVLQACYGVFDTENVLRRVMAESLEQYSACFKPRWKEHEILMAQSLDYKLDDYQLEQDWSNILSLANQPG